jgi:hypothetical protein
MCLVLVGLLSMPALAGAGLLVNPSFEVPAFSPGGYAYDPTAPGIGWTFSGGPYNGSGESYQNAAWGGPAEDGVQYAFLQGMCSISQGFTLASASPLSVSFYMQMRPGFAANPIAVYLDGSQIQLFPSAGLSSWTLETVNFGTLSAGPHTLAFMGAPPPGYGDIDALLDNVMLPAAPVPVPSALLLLGPGLAGLLSVRRRFRK